MFPNNPQNHQPTEPTGLPAVSPASQQQASRAVPSNPPSQPVAVGDAIVRSVAQAKQLSAQYGNDPYRLSEAMSQLKATYLAEQYHVVPNQVDNN